MARTALSFLVGCVAFALCTAKREGKVSDHFQNVHAGSKGAPFTRALAANADAQKLFPQLNEWFAKTSADVKRRRSDSDGSECTLRGQPWIDEADTYVKDRDMAKLDKSCATRTEHSGSNLTVAEDMVNEAATLFGNKSLAQQVIKSDPTLRSVWGDIKNVFAIKDMMYEKEDQKCTLNYLAAIRLSDMKWYVAVAITSRPPNRGGQRTRIVEHVTANFTAPARMLLAKERARFHPNNNSIIEDFASVPEENYTTSYTKMTGSAHISRIHNMQFDDNRALNNALEENILAVDQANDAITPANLAILILPLFMSFIPVALIADLSEVATFFYVLLTDVFAAVPFVIKGVELVITGTTTVRNAETWLVGDDDGVQVAETWVAACRPLEHFRTVGIIIITVGLASILSGILIEHCARKYMSRHRDKGENPEPFGPALLRLDAYIPVGANYMHPNMNYDDALAPNMAADLPPPPPAAPGPANGRVTNLFSGLLRRGPRRMRRAANDGETAARGAEQVGIVQPAPPGVRRRTTGSSAAAPTPSTQVPTPTAEYEEP